MDSNQSDEKSVHTIKSSNLPFYVAVWETAKSSRELLALQKRFYQHPLPKRNEPSDNGKRYVLVDIVSHDGEEWTKVSTVAEHRLLFEIAMRLTVKTTIPNPPSKTLPPRTKKTSSTD